MRAFSYAWPVTSGHVTKQVVISFDPPYPKTSWHTHTSWCPVCPQRGSPVDCRSSSLEHITDALASFQCLRAPERIKFKLTVIVYRAFHGTAPQYLLHQLQHVADLPTRRRGRLRSSTSSLLDVRPSRRVTVGDRSFAAAGPRLSNSLPADVQSAPSLTFRQKVKTHLFRQSYPVVVL